MNCIVCKEKIAKGATFCPNCSHYQNPWLNRLRFGASIAGILTVSVSAILFGVSSAPKAWRAVFPEMGLSVLELAYSQRDISLNVFNPGESDIWVSHVDLYAEVGDILISSTADIKEKVPAGEVIRDASDFYDIEKINFKPIVGPEPETWPRNLSYEDTCFDVRHMNEGHPMIKHYGGQYQDKLHFIDGKVRISYFNYREETWLSKVVSTKGMLIAYTQDCNSGSKRSKKIVIEPNYGIPKIDD